MWAIKNKKTNQNDESGFTIVELLIVIVVIAILAAITIISYTGIQDKARTASMQADARALGTQALLLKQDSYAYTDGRTWKQALINTRLYDAASLRTTDPTKAVAICSNSDDFVIAVLPPGQSESTFTDVIVNYSGQVGALHWNSAVTGATTLEKLCKQVVFSPVTYSNWAHNPGIRDATL